MGERTKKGEKMKTIICMKTKSKLEKRNDKYCQNYRIVCNCGSATNWHTEIWKASEIYNSISCNELGSKALNR